MTGMTRASGRDGRAAYIVGRGVCYPMLALALAGAPAAAKDSPLTVEASARVRGEAVSRDFRAGSQADRSAVLTRVNLSVVYDAGAVELGGEVQDARAHAASSGAVDEDEANALEPIQAWVRLRLSADTSLQIGRFTLDLGGRRFAARTNFRNTNNGFTGARLDTKAGPAAITAFWTMPSVRLPDDDAGIERHRVVLDRDRFGFQFFGGVATLGDAKTGAFEVTAVRLYERDAAGIDTRDRRLWGVGLRHVREPASGAFDHEVEVGVQGGRARGSSSPADVRDRRVAAGFIRAQAGYSFGGAWSPRLQLAADYASGDGRGDTLGRYDTFFGDGSFEFGPSSLYSLVARANLLSAEARVEVEPGDRTDGYLAVRPLWLARATDAFGNSGVRDPAGASGRHAGTQVEGRVRHWLVEDRLRLTGGAAWLARGRFLRDAPNAAATGDTLYGYLELSLEL